jgi:(4S)-4-hydroxy-5-phosphonooxypentane-2,3-dione isomerase
MLGSACYSLERALQEDTPMIIQSIRYTFAPEDADKAEALFRELQEASRREEGVLTFDVGRGRDEPNVFALWEVYRDNAALEAHMATDHFKRLGINGVRLLAKQRSAEIVNPI